MPRVLVGSIVDRKEQGRVCEPLCLDWTEVNANYLARGVHVTHLDGLKVARNLSVFSSSLGHGNFTYPDAGSGTNIQDSLRVVQL